MKAKRIVALLLALVMIFGLVGCGGEDEVDPAFVVAKVGDVEVTQREWDAYNELVFYGSYGYELSLMEEMDGYEESVKYMKNSMLSSLMASKVLKMDYEAQGVDVLGENYEADAELFLATVKAQIADFIDDHELTDEELLAYYESQMYLSYAMNEVAVAEEEGLKYFEEHKDDFAVAEDMVRASHILVEDEALAKDIIAQYEAGADFAALAAEHGTDGTKTTGGDLGPFVYSDMVEDFSKPAFELGVGEHTKEPVKSDFGYHVILVTDRVNKGEVPPYEWLKDDILYELDSVAYYEMLDKLMEQYPVEYFVDGECRGLCGKRSSRRRYYSN
ncbi:MAG: peptidylprolyl isomerase [Firmicutes bacterium]|nr:peptidylprolyl isomerase [Bacillota bacterium]